MRGGSRDARDPAEAQDSGEAAGARGGRERLSSADFLDLIREQLSAVAPELLAAWEIVGDSLRGEPGWAVALTPSHSSDRDHYDIAFVPDLNAQPPFAVVDCVNGIGPTACEAARRAVGLWFEGAGSCVLELIDRRGRFAEHLPGDSPHGVPGWYSLVSRAVGYGVDPRHSAELAQWAVDNAVVHAVADALAPALDRPLLNGVKIYYHAASAGTVAEVRVNGGWNKAASAALAVLDWPRFETFTALRIYALQVCPDDPARRRDTGGLPELPGIHMQLGGDGTVRVL